MIIKTLYALKYTKQKVAEQFCWCSCADPKKEKAEEFNNFMHC